MPGGAVRAFRSVPVRAREAGAGGDKNAPTPPPPLHVGFLAIAGGLDMVSQVFRGAIWNSTIPDELRGRLAGIELLSSATGPMLGNARAGLVAGIVGIRPAIASGGVLSVAPIGVVAIALPSLWRTGARRE